MIYFVKWTITDNMQDHALRESSLLEAACHRIIDKAEVCMYNDDVQTGKVSKLTTEYHRL